MKYTIGYDLGIGSVGWAVKNNEDNSLVDFGVRIYKSAESAGTARTIRSARRTRRRKTWRLMQLENAFTEFGFINFSSLSEEELYETKTFKPSRDGYPTIYHTRKAALSAQISDNLLYQAMHNIAKSRGHFYMEHIDFDNNSIELGYFCDEVIKCIEGKVQLINKQDLIDNELSQLFDGNLKNISKKTFVNYANDDSEVSIILEVFKALKGNKFDVEHLKTGEGGTKSDINKLKTSDDVHEGIIQKLIDLYDMLEVSKVLSEYDFLCEKHVFEIDRKTNLRTEDEKMVYKKEQERISKNGRRSVKNVTNAYPNGLYVKEALQILKTQQKYNEKVTDEFINIVISIIKAKIPYWMGPLGSNENTKNNWMVRKSNNKLKYSYDYSKAQFNEVESQNKWKELLIANCTYLSDEKVLSDNAFSYELFKLVNELNVLSAYKAGEYNLTTQDKAKVFEELFLKQSEVSFSEVKNILELDEFGFSKKAKAVGQRSTRAKFNNKFTAYHQIVNIIPELKVTDLYIELAAYQNGDNSKIAILDEITLNLCMLEDYNTKYDYFNTDYSDDIASKLAKINLTDYGRLSKKFIYNTPMNEEGSCLIDILFANNTSNFTNEQQTIITNAVGLNGKKLNFSSNKYTEILKEHNKLDYSLLMKNNKPMFPISRPVIRTLNELFKVHNEIIKCMDGVQPEKIIIETASDLGDPKQGETAKHYDKSKQLFDYILKQTGEKSIGYASEFKDIEQLLLKNKRKMELFLRQDGRDLITGKTIDYTMLENYQIDHILPRGFGDNSMDNLMLIHREVNAMKGDKTAWQYINESNEYSLDNYVDSVKKLKDMKLISENKYNRLMLESTDEAIGFVQRNLVDTRYIIREVTSIFNAYIEYNECETKVISLQGTFNGIFRRMLKMNKSRDLGHQHHAHDAAIIIIVDECLQTIYPNYNSGDPINQVRYRGFLQKIDSSTQADKDKAINTLAYMYKEAFGEFPQRDKFLTDVKGRVPLFSTRENRKYQGQISEATLISPKNPKNKKEKIEVFDIIGVNNNKRKFSAVQTYAIDLYKASEIKKGKRSVKHIAVHIPKSIINSTGQIDQDKYKALIDQHYNMAHLLLDGSNRLRTEFFRIRVFPGTLMYSTDKNELVLQNGGSMVNQKIDYQLINVFSYDLINEVSTKLIKLLNKFEPIDYKSGKLEVKYIIPIYEFLKENLGNISKFWRNNYTEDEQIISLVETGFNSGDKKEVGPILDILSIVYKMLKDEKSINEVRDYIVKLVINANTKYVVPTIFGQKVFTANSISGDDAQYAKIVASALGVRTTNSSSGKLLISGFNGKKNYKTIKKDVFSWQA